MLSFKRLQIVLLAALLTAAAATAFPQAPASRESALAALRSPESARRAEAIVWLAHRGGMNDAPLLHERLKDDESAIVRRFAERGLWLLWTRSGEAEIDQLMQRGSEEMQSGRHRESIATFSEVIRRRPQFAEGWNRRATAYFLAGEQHRSIRDCDEVLKRNPLHFGALSGLGQIYLQLQDAEQALKWFRRALEIHPGMVGVQVQIELLERQLGEKRRRSI